jgi:hypothetical protein
VGAVRVFDSGNFRLGCEQEALRAVASHLTESMRVDEANHPSGIFLV